MRKRQRTDLPGNPGSGDHPPPLPGPVGDDAFINDDAANESGGEDEDEDDKPKSDKKAGRRKIKIEFIQDKSRRHITFSKRKAGIMKKAYELSTLTGTQVLLLVVSETGLVYTFTTAKLQPLVTQPEGKNLIQACLNAPHGAVPSAIPVGPPVNRGGPMNMSGPPPAANIPGGLSISGGPSGPSVKEDDNDDDHADDTTAHGGRPSAGDKRRRRNSSTSGPSGAPRGGTSPHSPNATVPPLNIPGSGAPAGSPTSPSQQHQQVGGAPSQYTTSMYHHGQQQHHQPQPHDPSNPYSPHMMTSGYSYPGANTTSAPGAQGQQLGGLAAAAAQHGHSGHWQQPPVAQGGHYTRR